MSIEGVGASIVLDCDAEDRAVRQQPSDLALGDRLRRIWRRFSSGTPMAIPRMTRSAALLERQMRSSLKNRTKDGQRWYAAAIGECVRSGCSPSPAPGGNVVVA